MTEHPAFPLNDALDDPALQSEEPDLPDEIEGEDQPADESDLEGE